MKYTLIYKIIICLLRKKNVFASAQDYENDEDNRNKFDNLVWLT